MAADLATTPASGLRVQVCGTPTSQLRRLHHARAPAHVRPQRLRRDAARARGSGTSSGWPRASRSPAATAASPRSSAGEVVARGGRAPTAQAMREFAAMANLEVWYSRLDVDDLIASSLAARQRPTGAARRSRPALRQGAAHRTTCRPSRKLTGSSTASCGSSATRRSSSRSRSCSGRRSEDVDAGTRLHRILDDYRGRLQTDRRHLLDAVPATSTSARKVVGVGSVGTRAWIVLLLGRDGEDPLILQAKEAQPSVLEPYVGRSRVREPRPAGGGGPAAHAGRERHLPRLAARSRPRRRASATSTSASCGTARARVDIEPA